MFQLVPNVAEWSAVANYATLGIAPRELYAKPKPLTMKAHRFFNIKGGIGGNKKRRNHWGQPTHMQLGEDHTHTANRRGYTHR